MIALTPLSAYMLIVLAILLALLGIAVANMLVLPTLTRQKWRGDSSTAPSVAILVPARNEELNVEACLRSLLAQDYPNFEVWLYDDFSTDHTAPLARRLALRDHRLHVVPGRAEPPPGWLGKANACQQLYLAMTERSRPDYILFTDADVRFTPPALAHAIATAQARNAGLVSVFPRQITHTWAERLAVPLLLHWAVYTFLPLPLAFSRRTGPAFAAANGQFMLFTLEAYKACGGHANPKVRSAVLEDVTLAREVKAAGHLSILADAGPLVRTRMYTSAGAVWEGYSKNAYAFFGYSPFFLGIGILVLCCLYLLPVFFALYGLLSGQAWVFYLALAQYGIAVLARLLLALRFAYRPLDTLLHPLGVAYLIAIALNSMQWSLAGKGTWKGRGTKT